MNFINSYAWPVAGLTAVTLTYFTFFHKSTNEPQKLLRGSNDGPHIGDTVTLKIAGLEKPYHIFGATGHSLATCKLISKNCMEKTHNGQRLYFVTEEESLDIAETYANNNSEPVYREPGNTDLLGDDEIPAIAYLGSHRRIRWLFHHSVGSLGSALLNFSFIDVQVVHIKKLKKI